VTYNVFSGTLNPTQSINRRRPGGELVETWNQLHYHNLGRDTLKILFHQNSTYRVFNEYCAKTSWKKKIWRKRSRQQSRQCRGRGWIEWVFFIDGSLGTRVTVYTMTHEPSTVHRVSVGIMGKRQQSERFELKHSTYTTEWLLFPRGSAKAVKHSSQRCVYVWTVEYCLMYEEGWCNLCYWYRLWVIVGVTGQLAVSQMPPKERKLSTESRRCHPRVV